MYEQQNFFDLQEEENGSFMNDPKSWLSGEEQEEGHISQQPSNNAHVNGSSGSESNFDRVLYKNLVEIVPLVESLMGRRANISFTRRASLVYTKTPAKKISELKGGKAAHSIPAKKRGDFGDYGGTSKRMSTGDYSIFTARPSAMERDREPLLILQDELKNLQKKLLEKDELLKSTEKSLDQMTSLQVKLDELNSQDAEKDLLIRSVHSQLNDAKIKLADKQAALEKLQWEASTSNRKIEKLREDLESMHGEMSTFMLLLEGLTTNDCNAHSVDYDVTPYGLDQLSDIDDINEIEMQQMEEAGEAYVAALATAKESQDEESLEIAAKARLRLQCCVFKPKTEDVPGLFQSSSH